MSEIKEIQDTIPEEIKKPTGNEIEQIAKIDISGDKPKGEEVPDELKKEAAENKEVENYSDSIGEKFMTGINEHPYVSVGIQATAEISNMGNDYVKQLNEIKPPQEIVKQYNQESGESQIQKDFPGVEFNFDNSEV